MKHNLARDTIDAKTILVCASINMLRGRNHLRQHLHIAHVHELLWRPSLHVTCLPQGVNMQVDNTVGFDPDRYLDLRAVLAMLERFHQAQI